MGFFCNCLKKNKREIKCAGAEHRENKQCWKVMKKCRLISNTTDFLISLLIKDIKKGGCTCVKEEILAITEIKVTFTAWQLHSGSQ